MKVTRARCGPRASNLVELRHLQKCESRLHVSTLRPIMRHVLCFSSLLGRRWSQGNDQFLPTSRLTAACSPAFNRSVNRRKVRRNDVQLCEHWTIGVSLPLFTHHIFTGTIRTVPRRIYLCNINAEFNISSALGRSSLRGIPCRTFYFCPTYDVTHPTCTAPHLLLASRPFY